MSFFFVNIFYSCQCLKRKQIKVIKKSYRKLLSFIYQNIRDCTLTLSLPIKKVKSVPTLTDMFFCTFVISVKIYIWKLWRQMTTWNDYILVNQMEVWGFQRFCQADCSSHRHVIYYSRELETLSTHKKFLICKISPSTMFNVQVTSWNLSKAACTEWNYDMMWQLSLRTTPNIHEM